MAGLGGVSGKNRSTDPDRFAMVPRSDVPRSAFSVPHTHKTTFGAGFLVPLYLEEVLPGDSFSVRMTAFARLATPIVPVMDNLILESFFFFVPNRLVWNNWERFQGQQDSPGDITAFLIPQISITDDTAFPGSGNLSDYFGVTMNYTAESEIFVNALPFRGYNLIWNEWFRHQDLQDPAVVDLDDGPDAQVDYLAPQRRGKRHDYFTSCMPWPQKPTAQASFIYGNGSPAIPGQNMTLGNMLYGVGAPVSGIGVSSPPDAPTTGLPQSWSGARTITPAFQHSTLVEPFVMRTGGSGVPDIRVQINDLRTAVMLQNFLEKSARGGTRYSEMVRNIWGVTSPDARLQRPEYLGGGRAQVTVNPVAQTSASGATGTTTVLGELAGIGTAIASGHGFSQSFTEHGFVFGLICVRADMTYQNGTNRMWFRRTPFDIYSPPFAHLGEQAVLQKEIYSVGGVGADDNTVFGYQERWSEYKYKPNRVSGLFRSKHPTPLDMWHLAQNYTIAPTLNEIFMIEDPPVERVLQVATNEGEQFLVDSVFDCRYVRCMPMFSIPGLGSRL